MGASSSKRPRVLEPYISYDVLPTEYFSRKSMQQAPLNQQNIQPIIQPIIQPVPVPQYPQQQQAYLPQYNTSQQQFHQMLTSMPRLQVGASSAHSIEYPKRIPKRKYY